MLLGSMVPCYVCRLWSHTHILAFLLLAVTLGEWVYFSEFGFLSCEVGTAFVHSLGHKAFKQGVKGMSVRWFV